MIGITQKRRLEQILGNLEAILDEIRRGYYEDDSLQTAVYCQKEINNIVWLLNKVRHGTELDLWCECWIPVSDRFPSMRTEVIYSYDGIVSTGYITDRDCIGEKTEEHWEDLESGAYIEPIAWMPLPKPYKAESEEV